MDDHDLVEGGDVHVVPVDAERPKPAAAHRARGGAAGKEDVAHPVLGPADEDALQGAAHVKLVHRLQYGVHQHVRHLPEPAPMEQRHVRGVSALAVPLGKDVRTGVQPGPQADTAR
eukprot:10483445-Alexandrium_andersonii.AAC.1